MATPFKHCQIYQTSNLSEIRSVLEKNPLESHDRQVAVLIGSRAARHFLPNFRGISEAENADHDIIIFSQCLLTWLNLIKEHINTIDMIAPQSYDGEQLDLYICCELNNGSKYDFSVPRSATSYTAYILNHSQQWTLTRGHYEVLRSSVNLVENASVQLLLILKKSMLYYSHQWLKTAKDYRELLTVSEPLTANQMELCHLFTNYNEKLHGKRSTDSSEFTVDPVRCSTTLLNYLKQLEPVDSTNTPTGITIEREKFVRYTKDRQISLIYQLAMSLSYCDDIYIGLEHICTQSPLWLADCTIENWIDIFHEKFKYTPPSLPVTIQVNLENYRLFPEIPEIVTKRILHAITNIVDFYSIKMVCKRWYAILDEEVFWRDLYTSRFGACTDQTDQVYSWKMLYLIRMERKYGSDNLQLNQMVETTRKLRQYTAIDIVKLWEDFTHQDQPVETNILKKINYVLSNSFYYEIRRGQDQYLIRLILIGLEHVGSRSEVYLYSRVAESGSSGYSHYMEQLFICYESNIGKHSFDLRGSPYSGYNVTGRNDAWQDNMCFNRNPSIICNQYPTGLLTCLFIMMVHPDHRAQHIKYIKSAERHDFRYYSSYGTKLCLKTNDKP